MIPALRLAENDRHHGDLADAKQELIFRTTRDLVEDLAARARAGDVLPEPPAEQTVATPTEEIPISVLCLPSRDEADEIVGLMLAQVLANRGVRGCGWPVGDGALVSEMVTEVGSENPAAVCVSAIASVRGHACPVSLQAFGPGDRQSADRGRPLASQRRDEKGGSKTG